MHVSMYNGLVVAMGGGVFSPDGGAPTVQITSGTPLPSAVVGVFYSVTLTATGGTTPYTWSIVSGNPGWLSMVSNPDNTGTLSGTPTGSESDSIVIRVTDSSGTSNNYP